MKKNLLNLLIWSQKYTKTDMVYLTGGGFWLTTSKIIGIGTSFATSIAMANLLPESVYGTFRYVLSIVMLLAIPTLGGIDSSLIRATAQGFEKTFLPALKAKMKWGLLGMFGGLLIAGYYFASGNDTLTLAFLLAALFVPIMDPANLFLAHLAGKKEFKKQTYNQLIIRGISASLVIATVFLTSNVIYLLLVYFLTYTILRCFFLLITYRSIDRSTGIDTESIRFGMHLTLQDIPTLVTKTIDSILVFHFLGAAALAGYSLARLPMKQLQSAIRSINILALPNLSKRSLHEIKSTLPNKILKSYLIIIPLVILVWMIATPFFEIFYPKYVDFAFIAQLFILQLLSFPISLLQTTLVACGAKKQLYIHTLFSSGLRLTLLLILTPLFGMIGAVASILATAFIGSLMLIYLFVKIDTTKLKPNNIN